MPKRTSGKGKRDRKLHFLKSDKEVKGNKGNRQKLITLVEKLKRGGSILTEEDYKRLEISSEADRRRTCEAHSLARTYHVM
ncbi:MAG: hypothetical protein WCJ25_01775 [Candidatus Moraniibacteriota bacterium]